MEGVSVMSEAHDRTGNLSLLPALAALLETGSVTMAAVRVGVSQSAMSRTLSRLRADLGDPLLVRDGKRWRLTARGHELRGPLGDVLGAAAEMYRPASFDPATASRRFRLAIPDGVGAAVLPELYALVSTQAPTCSMEVVPWPTTDREIDQIDLAIASEPQVFSNFRMEPLTEDHDVLVRRRGDPQPSAGEELSRSHVAVVPAGFSRDIVDSWLERLGRSRRIHLIVPHYLQALNVVSRTALVGIFPSRLVRTLDRSLGLQSSELALPLEPDQYWLLHPPRLTKDPAVIWLRSQVRALFGDGASAPNGPSG